MLGDLYVAAFCNVCETKAVLRPFELREAWEFLEIATPRV